MLHCVIPLFGYVSLSGTPSCLYHTMQHKGRDKNSFWPQRSQSCHISLVCRLGRCCFELLKAMWNYLTKAWEEVPNLPLCCYLGDSLMSSEYHLHSHTMFPRALGEDAVQQFGVWKEVVGLTRRPNLMDSPKPHAISSPAATPLTEFNISPLFCACLGQMFSSRCPDTERAAGRTASGKQKLILQKQLL